MSDTPRTDAFIAKHHKDWPHRPWREDAVVYRDWAGQLERENAALRADNDYLREELREAKQLLAAWAPESARAALAPARKEDGK